MKTFDYDQVTAVLSPMKAKLDECAHGEGNECNLLDEQLGCCAEVCSRVAQAVTEWAIAVFSGEVVFDPQAESLWRTEATQIYSRATRLWQLGRKAEVPCWELPGQYKLQAALWELGWLLNGWVSPKLSVAPSARVNVELSDEERETIQNQLSSLPAYEPTIKS